MRKQKATIVNEYFVYKTNWDNIVDYMQADCFVLHSKGIMIIFDTCENVEKVINEQIDEEILETFRGNVLLDFIAEIDVEVGLSIQKRLI